MLDLAMLDELLSGGLHDLRGNGEARAGERAVIADDEGVDANQFAVRIDQGAAGVSGVDGRVSLDKAAGLASVIGVGIGPVDGAHDAARDRELEVAERASEGEHGLAGLQASRITPDNGGQVRGIHLDHREVSQFIGPYYLSRQHPAIIEGNADLGGAVHYVIIGDDVTVWGDDDAASDSVFDLRLVGHLWHHGAEELAQSGRQLLHLALAWTSILIVGGLILAGAARGDGDVHHGGCDLGGDGFHGLVERGER